MNVLPPNLEKKAEKNHFDDVSLVDSFFPIDSLASNKTPNKSSAALSNQIPTGMKFPLQKSSELKNNNMLLSTKTMLKMPCLLLTLFSMLQA